MRVEVLFAALWLGLFAAGATVLIRVLPIINGFVDKGLKPWVCDKCMSFWLVLFASTVVPSLANEFLGCQLLLSDFVLGAPASYGISLWVLRKLTDPTGPAPSFELPELIDVEIPASKTRFPLAPFSDPPNH